MKGKWRIIWLTLWIIGGICHSYASDFFDYGLYFQSHNAIGTERTSLFLDDGRPFRLKDDFTISFKMLVRGHEADFGPILHLSTERGQHIRFSFVSGEDRHYPALVFNEQIIIIDQPIERDRWLDVSVSLRPGENLVDLDYNGADTSTEVSFDGARRVTARFGVMPEYSSDVAPVNLRDVVVVQHGDTLRHWKLYRHDDDICYDEIRHSVARAQYPHWLIDTHIEWENVLHKTVSERLDVAFDAREARFFFVKEHEMEVWDEHGNLVSRRSIEGGFPATTYQNHLLYDTLSRQLVSYFPETGRISCLSPETGRWSCSEPNPAEPHFYNHARAFNPADSSFYFFGGYGFYQYRNELFRWKSGSDRVERVDYEQPFYPRYSAAAAVVGDELFIFGGRGNKYGKQEISSYFFCGMHAIDLKTLHSRQVWMKEESQVEDVMASTMYFHAADSSFYAVSMDSGGVLWRISMKDPVYVEVSKPIGNELNFQDGDFSLYASPTHGKLFLVMDKILSNRTHDVAIYSIRLPLAGEADIRQTNGASRLCGLWYWLAGLVAVVVAAWLLYRSKQKKSPPDAASDEALPARGEAVVGQESGTPPPDTPRFYDNTRSSILLMGNFRVFDRNGVEITSHFTPKLKHLLILLILFSEKDSRGILALKATEILWPDKDGNSARNNRNVSLRKLRVLLESIGDMEVVSENNFLRISLGKNVFCDYHEVISCIRRFQQPGEESDPELLDRIFELLLYGPLLPNTIADWLDDFKDAYSSLSIDLLKNLLALERSRNHQSMILRIANIMFLHDPLSEEALAAKCSVLSAQGKNGIARNIYDRFCKEYRRSIGEEFGTPFSDL